MEYHDKTKEEIIKELLDLKQEHIALKLVSEKYTENFLEMPLSPQYGNVTNLTDFRQKAEALLDKRKDIVRNAYPSESDALKLLHELEVYQIELEMQNEELKLAKTEAQDAIELYDFAPTGYFTLTQSGYIIKLNLSGAAMLGKARSQLLNNWFGLFVSSDSKSVFSFFLEKIFKSGTKETCDVELLMDDYVAMHLHLTGILTENRKTCLVTAVDISKRKQVEEDLTLSKQKLEAIIAASPDGIGIASLDGKIQFISDKLAEIYGYSVGDKQENLSKNFLDFIDPADHERLKENLGKLIGGKRNEKISEYRAIKKDKSLFYVDINADLLRDRAGKPESILFIERDITLRRQVEEKLRKSELQYRTLIETASEGILVAQGPVLKFANPMIPKITGYSESELLSTPFLEFIHPDYRDLIRLNYTKRIKGETIDDTYQVKILPKDKSSKWIELKGVKIDWEGEPAIMNFVTDITERKRMEGLVSQTRQNYETFFNTIDEFLFVLDEQGNIIHINKTVVDRLGYTREELSGKSVLSVHPPDRRDEAGRIVGEMLQGITEFCPVPLQMKSGLQIPVETRVTQGQWDGKPVIFGVTKDISQLRMSEEKFSKVFYVNPSACGLSSLETHEYIEVNPAFYSLFGFTKEEVIGKTAYDLGILSDEMLDSVMLKADNNGCITNAEADLRAKNGDIKHVLLSAENIYIQDKKYRFTVVHDITERKRAEDALKESELRYHTLFTTSPSGITVLDEDGIILEINDILTKNTLYTHDELIGKNIDMLSIPEQAHQIDQNIKRILAGEDLELEVINRRKDGTYCNFLLRETAINLPDGDRGVLSVSNDITQRKQAEKAVIESEIRLQSLTRILQLNAQTINELLDFSLNEAIKLTGSKLGYIYFYDENLRQFELFSWSKEVMVECTIREKQTLYYLDKTGIWGEAVRQRQPIMVNDFGAPNHLKKGYPEGHAHLKNFLTVPIIVDNNIIAVIGVANKETDYIETDIIHLTLLMDTTWNTYQKKHSEELVIRQNEELLKLNSEKDKFFSIIAHDLRGPFNGFLGLTQLLAEGISSFTLNELQDISMGMNKSAKNLFNLLNNLLEWSRMQQGTTSYEPNPVLLLTFVTATLQPVLDSATNKGISVSIHIPENLKALADENMLASTIRNLTINAVKFTPSTGKVIISAKATDDGEIEFSIKDSGIGMDAEILANMFKLDVSISRKGTEGEPSTGLGLLLCKDFIEKHGGRIWVESEVGKGSTIYFTLPLVNP